MNGKTAEIIAVVTTILGCAFAIVWPFFHEESSVRATAPPGAQIIMLTGVAVTGTWTQEDVNASNYWTKSFPPARPILHAGEPTFFRLKSSDVVHTFYCPGLGIGPLEVHAGHVVEVVVTPEKEGVFGYYCTTMCGDPHFGMRGEFIVQGNEESVPRPSPGVGKYWLEPPPPQGASRAARGKWLYRRMGCVACHGPEGRGGVPNWNYVKDTVPPLNTLAERLMLFEPEDVEAVVEEMERGVDLKSLVDDPPVPRFNVVLAQYNSVRDVIRRGNPAGKKDPQGVVPPLDMPAWGQRLSDADIDYIIAYLLTLQPWEEEEEEEEDELEDEEEEEMGEKTVDSEESKEREGQQ